MSWLEVSIGLSAASVAEAEAALGELGALAVTLADAADDPVLEPPPGSTPLWPTVQLRGLFGADVDRRRIVEGLQAACGTQRPDLIRWREIADRDWTRAWMDQFRPMQFGRRLWVVPSGMRIPPADGTVEIRMDPGLAFGTGTHPTTALCLEWLDGHDVSDRRVVDFGCGSGILGIAAALLGATEVACVDNDPQALEATAANAVRNGVGERLTCLSPEQFPETGADVVLANILAGPLRALAPVLTACLKPDGALVLSGLLEEQAGEVVAAYRPICRMVDSAERDGWVRLDLEKL